VQDDDKATLKVGKVMTLSDVADEADNDGN